MKFLQYKVPSTGIAANAIDDDVDVNEADDRYQVAVGPSNEEDTYKTSRLPFLPPPPPIPQNAYLQVFIFFVKSDTFIYLTPCY